MTSAALLIVQKRHSRRVKTPHNCLLQGWLQSRTSAPAPAVVTNPQKQAVDQQHPEPSSLLKAQWGGKRNCFGYHMRHGDGGLGPAARRACRPHLCKTQKKPSALSMRARGAPCTSAWTKPKHPTRGKRKGRLLLLR